MHKVTTRQRASVAIPRLAVAPIVVLVVALTAGCTQTKNWLQGRKTADPDMVILGAPETDQYISEIYRLVSGDPATQAEIFADASAAAQLTPDPSTRLRFALVLATSGHSGADPDAAQVILRDLLSQQELMTPGEISLATISLRQVEEQIMLGAETRRLRSENSRAASTEEAAVAQRMAEIEAENRRLKDSLTEAEAKLDAISSIERSIREQ